jgi:hypothetical protein
MQNLYVIHVKSPKLYETIVNYFLKQGFNEKDFKEVGNRSSVNFINALAYCYGELNNEVFFDIIKKYVRAELSGLGRIKLIKLLDIYKYF